MSAPTNDGGSAFPLGEYVIINGVPITKPTNGMTLRDYFAAKAMQGILSNSDSRASYYEIVGMSYKCADAMLEARKEAKP